MKKAWSKPKLIILIKGSPQESVLAFCKNGVPGPTSGHSNCSYSPPVTCPDCEELEI